MRRKFIVLARLCALLLIGREATAGMLQILPIAGQAYGIDGNNIVGTTAISHVGFLYDGNTYTQIAFPGAMTTEAYGISGKNIIGAYYDGSTHSFLYDGSTYSTFNGPPGAIATAAYGITGSSIFGAYSDSLGKVHGFVYDGSLWTTIDNPLGTKGTYVRGVSGNSIVGYYIDAKNRERGFLFNGSTFATLNDPLATGGTIPYGISGNTIVGSFSAVSNQAFVYDGATYTHPVPGSEVFFRGISGNKIVGYQSDLFTGIDHPIIYTIPEPTTGVLALIAAAGLAMVMPRRVHARSAGRIVSRMRLQ